MLGGFLAPLAYKFVLYVEEVEDEDEMDERTFYTPGLIRWSSIDSQYHGEHKGQMVGQLDQDSHL